MQRITALGLAALFLLPACSDRRPPRREVSTDEPVVVKPDVTPVPPIGAGGVAPVVGAGPVEATLPDQTRQERYEAALLEAVDFLAEQKHKEALAALEKAQKFVDTGSVQREIDKVRETLARQAAGEKAVADVKTVLEDGKPDEAARLANLALTQYGGDVSGTPLANLKQQADAVMSASAGVDTAAARRAQLRAEAEAALKDNNLRGAALSLEQVLAGEEDPDLRTRLKDVQARLTRYDDNRRRAVTLRRDPATIEEAIGLLKSAASAWDTVTVRQEIDECNLILERRRERVAVADFEVRGELGVPAAGRLIAEELLPGFKPRFDLFERAQLGRILDELQLDSGELTQSQTARREIARLGRVRYLVVGSLTPVAGVTLQARLIEVRTGLIAQTARLSAPSVEALLPQLRQVALMLQMTDEQKMAYEAGLARNAEVIRPIEAPAIVTIAPPPVYVVASPPPPIITFTPRPPDLGGLVIQDFARLTPVVVTPPPPPVLDLVLRREDPRRRRLLSLSLELGDNLFRRGRSREAQRHFALALTLAGPRREIQLRLDRCNESLPPPPPPQLVVAPPPVNLGPLAPPPRVVVAPPAVVGRPRMAVFGFVVNAAPGLVPPAVGDWAADTFASYCGGYELIDRGEVCWYMGRLGITMKEVLGDPAARLCLARSLNARYFVFGALQQTNSFDVTTHLVDAESGAQTGNAKIHVQDQEELKLRMQELAVQVGAKPADRTQLASQGPKTEAALNEARRLQKAGDNAKASQVLQTALKSDPNNVALLTLQQDADRRARQAALDETRRQETARLAAAAQRAKKQQEDLARQSAEARARATQEAKSASEAARRAQEESKARAAATLRAQAEQLTARGDRAGAVQALQAAVALKPAPDTTRELSAARLAADQAQKAKLLAEQKKREDDQRKQSLAAAQRVAREREARAQVEATQRKTQAANDKAHHDALMKQARDLSAKKQYAAALSAADSAHRILPSPESAALSKQAHDAIALAEAEAQGAKARAEVARQRVEEQKKRDQAAAELKRNQDAYTTALKEAQSAVVARRYDVAIAKYQAAGKLFRTDAVLSGLKQAQDLQAQEKVASSRKPTPPIKPVVDPKMQQTQADYELALSAGRAAVKGNNLQGAINAYQEALRLKPGDKTATDLRDSAQRALTQMNALAEKKKQEERSAAAALLKKQQDAEAARKQSDAMAAKKQADAMAAKKAADALAAKKAADALAASRKPTPPVKPVVDPKMKQTQADYELALSAGRAAVKGNNLQGAINAFQEALRLKPGDKTATDLRDSAQRALTQMNALAEKKKQEDARKMEEMKRSAEYTAHMQSGDAAMKSKNYPAAIKAYTDALQRKPGDPTATRSLADANKAAATPKPAPVVPPAPKPQPPKTPPPAVVPPKPMTPPPVAVKPPPAPAAEYAKWMAAGAALDKQKKFAEAVTAYTTALQNMPGDPRATAAIRNAQFELAMTRGREAQAAKKYPDAVKAFEEALKLQPTSAEAKDRLARAKGNKP